MIVYVEVYDNGMVMSVDDYLMDWKNYMVERWNVGNLLHYDILNNGMVDHLISSVDHLISSVDHLISLKQHLQNDRSAQHHEET